MTNTKRHPVMPCTRCGSVRNVALCGRRDRLAFERPTGELDTLSGYFGFQVRHAACPEHFHAIVSDDTDLMIVLQEYPGQYSQGTFDRLRRQAPLAPIVLLSDTLCRGELRTGRPIAGCRRFYLDEWNRRGRAWLLDFMQGKRSYFNLPWTSDDSDIAEALIRPGASWSPFSDAVPENCFIGRSRSRSDIDVFIVCEADIELGRCVKELCEKMSLSSQLVTFDTLLQSSASPLGIVVDSIDLADRDFFGKTVRISDKFPDAFITILAFGPSSSEIAEYESLPNCRVCGKPF